MKRKPLYIETKIKCSLDTLWMYTQEPAIHQQWDLRFSEIKYLPKNNLTEPQRFCYSTKIGFGIKVKGIGESVATKAKGNGESTSVLKFSSNSPVSIIKEGSGYWKYIPEADGIKFSTGYDYTSRWGWFGKTFDRFVFRPLMIWATAWSFDCLKKWIEGGLHPKQSVKAQLTILFSNIALGIVWIYQGLVPKILFTDTGEMEFLNKSGLFQSNEKTVLFMFGIAEIVFGLIILFIQKKSVHIINMIALLLLAIAALISNATVFTFPFNPFSLSVSMIALSILAIIHFKNLPKASNCITKPKQ